MSIVERAQPAAVTTDSAAPRLMRGGGAARRRRIGLGLILPATLLVLSAANWAYTWLRPGADTDALADRFATLLADGVRGYASAP